MGIGLDNAYLESVTNAKTIYYSRILSYRDAFFNTLRHVTTRLEIFVNDFDQNFDNLVKHVKNMECLKVGWLLDFVDKEKWPEMPGRLIELGHSVMDGGVKIVQEVVGECPRDGWFLWL